MLTIALPKGRIAQETLSIFSKFTGEELIFENRKLVLETKNFKFLLVRNQDVPVYVYHQSADIGVVGFDVIEEKSLDIVELMDLGIGRCKIIVGTKKDTIIDYTKPEIKIATKMPNITKRYFSTKAMSVEIVKLYGSIELAPITGLADAIVDISETGATLRENGLIEAETIMTSTARIISNRNSIVSKKKEILKLIKSIQEAM